MSAASDIGRAADALYRAVRNIDTSKQPTQSDLDALRDLGFSALFISPEVAKGFAAMLNQHATTHADYECRWGSCGALQVVAAMGLDS